MDSIFVKIVLPAVIAGVLWSAQSPAHVSAPDPDTTITLDKPVEFEDLEGELIFLEPGTYTVEAEEEALRLTSLGTQTSNNISAEQGFHTEIFPHPAAVSFSGQDGVLANRHVVMLFQPDGIRLQAIGSYPGLQSRSTPEGEDVPDIEEAGSLTTVTLEQPIYFMASDASPVLVKPGSYTLEPKEKWLRLIPEGERHKAILIEARQGTPVNQVEETMAFSLPGTTEKELDLHHLLLLRPEGPSLEATGSYSGIQPRNIFQDVFKTIENTKKRLEGHARNINKAAAKLKAANAKAKTMTPQQQAAYRKMANQKVRQFLQGAAKVSAAETRRIKEEAARLAKRSACQATVGLIHAGKTMAGFMQKLIPVGKQKNEEAQRRFNTDKNFHDQLIATVTHHLQANQEKIPQLKPVATLMNQPQNKPKLDAIFSTNNFCGDSIPMMDKKLIQSGMAPPFATVQTRGTQDEHFFLGYQVTFGAAAGVGVQVGLMGVTDFQGNGGKYWFIGPQGVTNLSGGVTAEVAFFPKVSLDSFEGWGAGVGISAGPPSKIVSGAVDVMLDHTVKKFQGFGFGPGVGLGAIPIDAAFSYTHTWKY